MTRYKHVSVYEYTDGAKEGERCLDFGKGEETDSVLLLPLPSNGVETHARMTRERVLVSELPREMGKSEVKVYLNENQSGEVWAALEGDSE